MRLETGFTNWGQCVFAAVDGKDRPDPFAVAQRAPKGDHAFDVTETILPAAVAPNKRDAALGGNLFLANMGIDIAQCRFAFEQQQKIVERSLSRFRRHAGMNGFDKFQIIRRIDGQPTGKAGQSRIGFCSRDGHEIRMKLEISRDMFPRHGIVRRVHHQFV